MKIVGLTGGIGTGKTTVANAFTKMGVPVYIADEASKKLVNTSAFLRESIMQLLGSEAYKENVLNSAFVASKVFKDSKLLKDLNAIIHPEVAKDFKQWVAALPEQPYCIKEAAILFESGSYKQCDATILVQAPLEVRITRLLKRDNTTREAILNRMASQWPEPKKEALATYIIYNKEWPRTQQQIVKLHQLLSAN